MNVLPVGFPNTAGPPARGLHVDEKPLSVQDEVTLHAADLAGLVRGSLRAPDAGIAAKLSQLETLAASANPQNAVMVKRQMREALWTLRQALDQGPAQGRTPEIKRAFEKLRGLCFDRGLIDAMGPVPGQRYEVRPCEIPNFERVTTGLLRGGQPDADGAAWLLADGVKTEVDLRGNDGDNAWIAPTWVLPSAAGRALCGGNGQSPIPTRVLPSAAGRALCGGNGQSPIPAWTPVKRYLIPVEDLKPPTFAQVEEFCRIVDDPANQPVYVHCKAGVGRTGAMIACWRITRGESLDYVLAQERLRSYDGSLAQEGFVRAFADWWKARS